MVESVKKRNCECLIRKYVFTFELEWTGGTLQKHQLPSLAAFNIPHSSEFEGAAYNKASTKKFEEEYLICSVPALYHIPN